MLKKFYARLLAAVLVIGVVVCGTMSGASAVRSSSSANDRVTGISYYIKEQQMRGITTDAIGEGKGCRIFLQMTLNYRDKNGREKTTFSPMYAKNHQMSLSKTLHSGRGTRAIDGYSYHAVKFADELSETYTQIRWGEDE
ncbi:MAG: hypothetical protein ACLSAP_00555 [Oscillospiraceae bacterium]